MMFATSLLLLLIAQGVRRPSSADAFQPLSLSNRQNARFQTPSWLRSSTNVDAEDSFTSLDTFADLGLPPEVLSSVRSQPNWIHPTPVQQLAIPKLLRHAYEGRAGGNEDEDDFYSTALSSDDDTDSSNGATAVAADALWCEAPTGSGKTAAYVLPLLNNLLTQPRPQHRKQKSMARISSLILCPTRELAEQIGSVVYNLANNVSTTKRKQRWNILSIYGGIPLEPQISKLADLARNDETLDVLIATPGRLVDVLTYYATEKGDSSALDAALERRLLDAFGDDENDASLSLEQIESLKLDRDDDDGRGQLLNLLEDLDYFIVDEADRLLGRAFNSELDAVLKLLPTQKKVQSWLFSATFPKQIEPRVNQVLRRIYSIRNDDEDVPILRISCSSSDRMVQEEVSSSLQKKLERSSVNSSSFQQLQSVGPASTIAMRTIRLERPARTQALRTLLEDNPSWDRVLVFVSTRYSAEHVSRKLKRAGILSAELHGKLDQDARSRRLKDLKRGKIRVLLATDVASRGIDISNLPVMVNYDLPRSTADFVHRIGRVGRAGQHGTAITFVTPETEAHLNLIEKRHLPQSVDRENLPGFEPNEDRWSIGSKASTQEVPGVEHSDKGLAHDKMYGGVKGRRKSKKDKLREAAARKAANNKAKAEAE